jgi:hypothetical protein
MTENQPPQPDQQQPAVPPSAPEQQPPEAASPEAAPTDFRRNVYLLLIILGVVVAAWAYAVLSKPAATAAAAPGPQAAGQAALAAPPAAGQPAAPGGGQAKAASQMPAAEPVMPVGVIGSDRVLIGASPAHLVKSGDRTYLVPEQTFDATQTAPGVDRRGMARLAGRWAGQRVVVAAAGKLQEIFQPASTVTDLQPDDRVVVLTMGKETHVYPVDFLSTVACVADEVAGSRVAIVWSPVTQAARCLAAEVDGKPVQWEDAGLVYRGDEVLFDAGTGSLWDSFSGAALTGPMAGKTAQVLPVQVWPWGQWHGEHPASQVLLVPGFKADKDAAQHIEKYLGSSTPPVPLSHKPETPSGVSDMAFVLGLAVGKEARAYDLGALFDSGKRELKDTVGGKQLEIEVTSPRTAVATSDGQSVDAPVMLYFGWREEHPETTLYGQPTAAAGEPKTPQQPTQ